MTNQPDIIRLDLPGTYKYLNVLGACIEAMLNRIQLFDRDRINYGIQLATHECCTNIVEHAYQKISGRIFIIFTYQPESDTIMIDLFDTGIPYKQIVDVKLNSPDPQTKGYGLSIINQVMDSVSYTSQGGKNHWQLSKKLSLEER